MNYYRVPASAGDLAPPELSTQEGFAQLGQQASSEAIAKALPLFALAAAAILLFGPKTGFFHR